MLFAMYESASPVLRDVAAYVGVIVVAGVASAVNSIAGGGTFLTFPTLTGPGHLTEKAANMTSTVGLWPGSAAAIVPAVADLKRIPKGMLIGYSVISLLGGWGGAALLLHTSVRTFQLVI